MRTQEVTRKTKETEVKVKVNLDGEGKAAHAHQACRSLDHMITSLATHSLIDIDASVKGDLAHHCTEDLAIGLRRSTKQGLGHREGITRFGNAAAPMDCSLAFAAVDLVKRPYFKIDLKLRGKKVEEMPTEDIVHFFESLARRCKQRPHLCRVRQQRPPQSRSRHQSPRTLTPPSSSH